MRIIFAGLALTTVGVVFAIVYIWDQLSLFSPTPLEPQIAEGVDDEPFIGFAPAIVDLAGDPLIISIGQGGDGVPKIRPIARPPDITDQRVSEKLQVLADTMLSSSERFMTTLPSRQQDFAFFQAQSGRRQDIVSDKMTEENFPAAEAEPTVIGKFEDSGGGWGETISGGIEELPEFKKTKIENNTSVVETTREVDRFKRIEDFFVRVLSTRTLDSFLLEHRISATDAKLAGEAMKKIIGIENLEVGYVAAIRTVKSGPVSSTLQLVQVSIYSQDTYLGTLAISDQSEFVAGADPWVRDDLFNYSEEAEETGPKRQYRLLDAIYSTAARNNMSSSLIGETIQLMSRTFDLNAFTEPDDRLLIVFSDTARDGARNSGKILYAGVQGPNKNLECFSFRPKGRASYSCITDKDEVQTLTVRNGMVTPVNGVLTSRFGPRKHPVLKTVRMHKGVDWAAPTGTPVYAAFDGKINFAGDGGSYGNFVKISHSQARETRYAHMDRIATEAKAGRKVKAGDIIGYVGTTGRSTGPHLHFELYRGKRATNPLATAITYAGIGGKSANVLVDSIIRIESGGRADAKNPLSSASGLGQFISSTWMKMINRYRPDLAKSLSRQEILNLRFEPTIAREMLLKFTRENEAYLRSRGHAITPGRLYLAHFLGSAGANTILRSPTDMTVASVMGNNVMKANPFLNGWNVAKIINWAERKMSRRGKRPPRIASSTTTTRKVRRVSVEFKRYKAAIQNIVRSARAVL